MSELPSHVHDLFISHARADIAWVHGYLLPTLGLPPERIITEQNFARGTSLVAEFEQAIQNSRLTVLVYSPAFPANEWTDFSERLASHLSVETQRERVVLLLLQPCEIPLRLELRLRLDCTDAANWDQEVRRLRDFLDLPDPNPEDIPCPYPGMAPFRQEDAQRFFGRKDEIQELRQRLDEQSLILVMGPSGSGKSSLLSAGLIPALTETWAWLAMRPGADPFGTLRSTLAGVVGAEDFLVGGIVPPKLPGKRLLLIVDQLEELFVQASKPDQTAFIDTVSRLHQFPGWTVILVLRADFFSDLMNSRLWPLTPEQRLEVAPLHGEGLRPVIQRPANDLKVHLEAGLIEKLIADAKDEPGVLPLLQQTMVLLWEKRKWRLLSLSAYQAMGDGQRSGLATSVATKADEVLAQLASGDQLIARRIFVRLVAFGEGRADTRRQQPISAIVDADSDQATHVVQHLAQYRLLTLGEKDGNQQTVDIAHDVLITGWPAFGEWLRKWRAAELTRRRLQAKAEEWKRWNMSGQRNSGLLDSAELAEAEQWLACAEASDLGSSPTLRTLVDKSRAALKRSMRVRVGAISALVALVIAVLAAVTIGQSQLATQRGQAAATAESLVQAEVYARSTAESEVVVRTTAEANAVFEAQARATAQANAEQERNIAVARQLAAQAQTIEKTSGQLDTAILLATESMRRDTNPDASLFLQRTLDRLLPPLLRLSFTGEIGDAVFSESGDRVAVATADQQIHVVAIPSGNLIAELTAETPLRQLAFCHGSAQLLAVETTQAVLWALTDAHAAQRIPMPAGDATVQFDASCRWLVILSSADTQQRLEFWNLQRGRKIGAIDSEPTFHQLHFSPSGEWLLTITDDAVKLWHPEKAELARTLLLEGTVRYVAFSNGGDFVTVSSSCGSAKVSQNCHVLSVVDLGLQKVIAQLGQPDQDFQAITFSSDDSRLIGAVGNNFRIDNRELELFGSLLGTIRGTIPENPIYVWRTDTWGLKATWEIPASETVTHSNKPLALSFSQRIVTVWDIETGDVISQFDVGREVSEISWVRSDIPRWVTTIPAPQTCENERCVDALEVWDVRTGSPVAQLSAAGLEDASYRIDPSERYALAWSSTNNKVVIWELIPRKRVALDALTDFHDLVLESGFSPDNAWLTSLETGDRLYVWRLPPDVGTDGTPWHPWTTVRETGRNAVISPDSRWVATSVRKEGRLDIRMLDTGEIKFTAPLNGEPIGFTEDGTRLIATDQKEGRDAVVVWDIGRASEDIRFSAPPLESYYGLNKRGTRLAVTEPKAGDVVHIYDLDNGQELMRLSALRWAMNASGTLLAVAGPEGRRSLELWSVDRNTKLAETEINGISSLEMLAFSDTPELLVGGSTLSVRRLPDLKEVSTFALGDAGFFDISPDGKWIFVSQGTGGTYIVDAHTGTRAAKLWIPGPAAYKIAFNQDDERVVVVGVNGEKRVLTWKPESLVAEACARLSSNLTEREWVTYLPSEPYRKTCPNLP